MKACGLNLSQYQGNGSWTLPFQRPSRSIENCCVIARLVNPDFRTRMEIDEISRPSRA